MVKTEGGSAHILDKVGDRLVLVCPDCNYRANANAVTSNRSISVLVPVKSRLVLLLLLPHQCRAPLSSSQDTKPYLFRHT